MLDKMAEQFKELSELQAYADSQFQTILNLNKKINQLEEENKELRKVVENNSMLIGSEKDIKDLFVNVEDPEAIALMQLKILRNLSIERDLTMEETKRYEIYCKVLDNLKNKKDKSSDDQQNKISDEELLKAMGSLTTIKIG